MSFASKFKTARELKGISAEDLADKLEVSRQTIYDWEAGKSEPRKTKLYKIREILQIDDTHHMEAFDTIKKIKKQNIDKDLIPFYDTVAVGGNSILADQSSVETPSEMINPGTFLKGATGALRVYGHSMYPKYPSGCIVAYRASSTNIPAVIVWGEDYVIELEDRRIIKKVDKGDTKDSIKAISMNGTNGDKVKYQYDTIDIEIKNIKRMYMVLGKVELEASI